MTELRSSEGGGMSWGFMCLGSLGRKVRFGSFMDHKRVVGGGNEEDLGL